MTTQLTQTPPITVSTLDLERIEQLLAQPAYKNLPGVDALQKELNRAHIVEPDEVPPTLVTMNSQVRFSEVNTGKEFTLTLVYPGSQPTADAVSIFAPVGSALLGLSVGQSIAWQVPGGRDLSLTILAVTYQPEASGDLFR
jgi:regulator of nucleoside diphosphate kinase